MDQDVYVYNALNKAVTVQAFGNYFTFKPQQIKLMRGEIGEFIIKEKAYLGLVGLSQEFEDPEYKQSEAGQAALEEKRQEGVNRRIQALQAQVHNLTHSLAQDLNQAEMKIDVLTQATKGDLAAMEELRGFQVAREDEEKQKLERVRILERQLRANTATAPAAASRKEE